MAEKKQAAMYLSENQGNSQDRPGLERLIKEAGQESRGFDAVVIHSTTVLGTPEEARNAIAKFTELGIEVMTVVGGIGPYGWEGDPGRVLKWLSDSTHPSQDEQEEEARKEVSDLLQRDDTTRMIMNHMAAVGVFETRDPVPPEIRRELRWPSESNLYIEYARPIIVDPVSKGDPEELMQGIIVAQGENPRAVTTIMTTEGRMLLDRSWINLESGTAGWGEHMPEGRQESDRGEGQKEVGLALTGLAALINHPDTKITRMPTAADEDNDAAWRLIEPK